MDWILKQQDEKRVEKYTNELKIPKLLATVILNRNMTIRTAYDVLYNSENIIANPLLLPGIQQAAKLFIQCVYYEKRPVEIFADYDCDGLTAGFILKTFCECWPNCSVNLYYPEREEGYGLSLEYAEHLIEKYNGQEKKPFVITVDNGISQIDEINLLVASNFPVLVTDHHLPQREGTMLTLPNCLVFDPHVYLDSQIGKNLCGAAVIWNLCRYIEQLCHEEKETPITDYCLYAAALGTISDMMTLDTYNMALINAGLKIMNSEYAPPNIKLFKQFYCNGPYTYKEIAFSLAPMLNACGRMGNTKAGAAFFFEDDEEKLLDILHTMDVYNDMRKNETNMALKEIQEETIKQHHVCFHVASDKTPRGLYGLIASKLLNQYGKPTFVVGEEDPGVLNGSCRSNTIPLPMLLQDAKESGLILSFGGHKAAGGIALPTQNIDDFIRYLDEKMLIFENDPAYEMYFRPGTLSLDAELQLEDITGETQETLDMLPYARNSFKQPIFIFKNLDVVNIRHSKNNEENVQISVADDNSYTKSFWLWNRFSQYADILESDKPIDIAATLTYNFQRKGDTTLDIIDIRQSEEIA